MSWTYKLLDRFMGEKKLKDDMIGAARCAEVLTLQQVATQDDRIWFGKIKNCVVEDAIVLNGGVLCLN